MKFENIEIMIEKVDITKEKVDCIVNAANSYLQHGGGVALAISRAGGHIVQEQSDEYIKKHGKVKTGNVAVTDGGNLQAKFIIHAVGPVWKGGENNERNLLYNAVTNSLREAEKLKCSSIAIPAISSGIFGFPVSECAKIFKKALIDFGKTSPSYLKIIKLYDISTRTIETFKKEFKI